MILLLDNNDSFVHNLARYFRRTGAETTVVRSNVTTADEVLSMRPRAVVLSPGPHAPDQAGCCLPLVRQAPESMPILGVCLGHQVIGQAFGGQIVQVGPRHGMTSPINHLAEGVFRGCPSPMNVARYHSLAIASENLPDCLEVIATSSDDDVIMECGIAIARCSVFSFTRNPLSAITVSGSSTTLPPSPISNRDPGIHRHHP